MSTGLRRRPSLSTLTLLGLLAGIAAGLFFGEYCAQLGPVGEAFVGLLRMTVLPFIIVSTVANVAKMSRQRGRQLALVGGFVLAMLWAIALFTVAALTLSFPDWKAGSFFSVARMEAAPEIDFLAIFIPSNVFTSLTDNHIPGVILFCVFLGVALSHLRRRRILIAQLDVLGQALIRVSSIVTRLSPLGVFAIAASTAGTMTLREASRLQGYLLAYVVGAVLLGALIFPLFITAFTPFRYRDIAGVSKTAVLTVFATGKLIIVLPLLVQETERLFQELEVEPREEAAPAVEVLYPLAYAFPHAGKLLALLFIPFTAWFLGHPLHAQEYPLLLTAGLFSYFGGPLLLTPFLLDLMHLPHDMFQLFLLAGVVAERVGDALGAIHLVTFVLITTCALTGHAVFRARRLLLVLLVATTAGMVAIGTSRIALSRVMDAMDTQEEVIAKMQQLDEIVDVKLIREGSPNPRPLREGETLLDRVRSRGILRVGYNDDKLPFAFFNASGQLVGFDVSLAEALARDLGVFVQFVRFDRETLVNQLEADHFDALTPCAPRVAGVGCHGGTVPYTVPARNPAP